MYVQYSTVQGPLDLGAPSRGVVMVEEGICTQPHHLTSALLFVALRVFLCPGLTLDVACVIVAWN